MQCVELKVEQKYKIQIIQRWEGINRYLKLYGTCIIGEQLCYYMKVDYNMMKLLIQEQPQRFLKRGLLIGNIGKKKTIKIHPIINLKKTSKE